MQTVKRYSSASHAMLFAIALLACPIPAHADSKKLTLGVDFGMGDSSNLGDDSLSETTSDTAHDTFQLGVEIGYMYSKTDQISGSIQWAASGIVSLKRGEEFTVFNPILSAYWHHYFETGLEWLEFETLVGLGLGLVVAPAYEDAVPTGPVFIHAGAGVVFFPNDWFGIGINARARVGLPAHIPWVAGMICTSFQFRFDL